MLIPFTRDQFFAVFAAYNSATWPVAILAYPLAIVMLGLALRGGRSNARIVAVSLALLWGFAGVVYHGLFFSRINPAAPLFAAAFVLQAAFFAAAAARDHSIAFEGRGRLGSAIGLALIFYAMVAYPLIGLIAGERYPAIPLFATAPCPLLIFTFGLFVLAGRVRWWLWVTPLLWSLIGTGGFYLLDVPQDALLPAAALAAILFHAADPTDPRRAALREI